MKKDLIIYTVITNNKDTLFPIEVSSNIQCVAFLDTTTYNELKTKQMLYYGWDIQLIDKEIILKYKDPRRISRYYKFKSHILFPNTTTLYLDASTMYIQPLKDIHKLLKDVDIVIPNHPTRNCLYQEAEICKRLWPKESLTIIKQVCRYREDGFPKDYGLFENRAILRKDTPSVEAWNNKVWEEYNKGCFRDQVCAQYATWKLGTKIGIMPRDRLYVKGHNK